MSTGLKSVIYFVGDLAVAKRWYTAAFEVEPYFDEPFYVGYQVGASELGLDPDLSAGLPGPGGSVAYWGVESLEAAIARIAQLLLHGLLEAFDVAGHLFAEPVGPSPLHVSPTRIRADGEAGGHRELQHGRHLGEVDAFAPEKILHCHGRLAVLVVEAVNERHR